MADMRNRCRRAHTAASSRARRSLARTCPSTPAHARARWVAPRPHHLPQQLQGRPCGGGAHLRTPAARQQSARSTAPPAPERARSQSPPAPPRLGLLHACPALVLGPVVIHTRAHTWMPRRGSGSPRRGSGSGEALLLLAAATSAAMLGCVSCINEGAAPWLGKMAPSGAGT